MPRVLAMSSQVAFGPVGNTAAVPALQAAGHDVVQIPTILMSHHPGHGKPVSLVTDAGFFGDMLASVEDLGALTTCAAVMTGYFATAAQVSSAAALIERLQRANPDLVVLVDPVLGDHGKLYVAPSVAAAIRDQLLSLATITTPNAFELSWLTGQPVSGIDEAMVAARSLCRSETLVTSIAAGSELATLLVTATGCEKHVTPRRSHVPHGTGDFLVGCYLARRLTKPAALAFAESMKLVELAIELSAGSPALAVAEALATLNQRAVRSAGIS